MSKFNAFVRRIFGGKSADGNIAWNTANQADGEALAVGTVRRVFKGPQGFGGFWSYHGKVTSVAGATSTVKFYYSNLPDPDPTNSAHWVDSGITAWDLTSTTAVQATKTGVFYEHIMAEAVVANSGGQLWLWVRTGSVEV
jgi:hypothetical protein